MSLELCRSTKVTVGISLFDKLRRKSRYSRSLRTLPIPEKLEAGKKTSTKSTSSHSFFGWPCLSEHERRQSWPAEFQAQEAKEIHQFLFKDYD